MFSAVRRWAVLVPAVAVMFSAAAQTKDQPAVEKKKPMSAKKEIAVIESSMGTFEIELYRADAPKTVENFTKLAGQKFFDGTRFHRVSKGFVIQGGDDKSKDEKKAAEWGTGGKSIYGKEFEDELNPATPSFKAGYKKGVVAMANRGPNTNTSQFFVMLNDAPGMPKNYTIFGKVVKGLDVVEKIGQVEIVPSMSQTDGRPKTDVMIKKVTVRTEAE
jgi:cyclophilin family peptidyl-prolyl cis-trans isomerase